MIYLFTKYGIETYETKEIAIEDTSRDLFNCILVDEEDLEAYKEFYKNKRNKFYAQFNAAQQNARRNLERFLENN